MARHLGTVKLCLLALGGFASATHAQIRTEIPTMVVGTPTFSETVQWPEVAVATDGTVVFIWSENGYQQPSVAVTHAYTADGVALSAPWRINESGRSYFTNVTSDLRGGFVAAWDWNENNGNDRSMAHRLDGYGRAVGSQIVVNADHVTPTALLTRAAGLPSGSVFMWEEGYGIWLRLFDANGVGRGGSFALAPDGHILNVTSDVVGLSDGGFVAAWADLYNGRSWARIYDGNGQPRGPTFALSNDFDVQNLASFAGGWAAIGTTSNREWSDPPPPVYTPNRIIVRQFTNDGAPLGEDIVVRDAGFSVWLQTDVTFDVRGNLYAAWVEMPWSATSLSPPYARAFDSSGVPFGDARLISDKSGYDVRLAALPNGSIVNVWDGQWNVPYEQNIYATWVRICAEGESCEAPPRPTPSITPSPTPTPTPAPACGDGTVDPKEECDDANRVNGDGCDRNCLTEECGDQRLEGDEQCDPPNGKSCRSDCTLAPEHDSVMVAEKPIDIVIPAGQTSVTKILPMQVRNADVEPFPERPGHVIQLVASDGDCPAGTVQGLPDFDRGIEGDQDSIQVPGGTPRTALLTLFASRQLWPELDGKIPARCTLVFTAVTLVDGNIDPTPENNTVTVEVNVRGAGTSDTTVANASPGMIAPPGFFVGSLKPLKVKLKRGQFSTQKLVKARVRNGLPAGSPDRQVQLTVDDGTCPAGTVAILSFAGLPGGAQMVSLHAGASKRGTVAVSVDAGHFTSANAQSPDRCTAAVLVTDSSGSAGLTNQRTTLVVEITDHNDQP